MGIMSWGMTGRIFDPPCSSVVDPLASEELVGVGRLTQPVEEQGQVVVVVKLLNFNLPCYFVSLCVMLQGNGEVSTLIELAEVGGLHIPRLECSSVGGTSHLPLELFLLLALALDHFARFMSSETTVL